jgi:ribonuclease HII
MNTYIRVAGVDEAGRGPLAGAVFAAAVVLDPHNPVHGLDDSKKLSEKRRSELEQEIKARSLGWSIAQASVTEIDRINILQASLLAMKRAIEGLDQAPNHVLVDGNRIPDIDCPCLAVVGGDAIHAEISAASILAKQARDRYMIALAGRFPQYGFDRHKGYPTRAHITALEIFGVTEHHRRTFGPVRRLVEA